MREELWYCDICDCELERKDFKKHRGHRLRLIKEECLEKKE
jgi:hypothetical protein